MKKIAFKKAIMSIIVIICMITLIPINIYAADSSGEQVATDSGHSTLKEVIEAALNFIKIGQNSDEKINQDSLKTMSSLLYNTLLIIGIILAVIIGLILGIKFMTGGLAEKAKVKETLIPYVSGCIVIFGAFTIWKIVVTILQGLPTA